MHAAQHTQGILAESAAGRAQYSLFEVRYAAEEIEQLARDRIEREGVDGEIAAAGGFARGDVFVEGREKIAMTEADLVIAPRHAEVARLAVRCGEVHHAETLAHHIDAPVSRKNFGQPVIGNPVYLDVDILRLQAKQRISHGSADHQRTKASPMQVTHDRVERRRKEEVHPLSLSQRLQLRRVREPLRQRRARSAASRPRSRSGSGRTSNTAN